MGGGGGTSFAVHNSPASSCRQMYFAWSGEDSGKKHWEIKPGRTEWKIRTGTFDVPCLVLIPLVTDIATEHPCSCHTCEATYRWGNGSHVREITHFTDKERIILSVPNVHFFQLIGTMVLTPPHTVPGANSHLAVSSALRCTKLCDALLRQHLFLLSMPLYLSF